MKYLLKYTWPIVAMFALAACNKEMNQVTPEPDPNEGKEMIAFSQEGAETRAALTRAGFASQTKVYMRIKAEATDKTTRYTEATATASANIESDDHNTLVGQHSDLNYNGGQERYWDDAFGRDSKLTVYAFAIPDKTDATLPTWDKTGWNQVDASTNPNWYTATSEDKTVTWSVSTSQTATTMGKEDLAYSNNIKSGETVNAGRYHYTWNTSTSVWDVAMAMGQMIWQPKTNTTGETTGKFDQGHLVFKHALSWIEINLKEGAGFDNTKNTDFIWTASQATATQNITLVGFNTSGTFDVSNGSWSSQNSANITTMNETTGTAAALTTRQLYAYVVPGTNLYTTSTNVIKFEIDNAQYYVTGTQIAEAIRKYYTEGAGKPSSGTSPYDNFTSLEAGKHYVINLTVAKKGIDRITAAIIDWETVNSSDADADNTYCSFDFEDRNTRLGSGDASKFNIYRAAKTAENYITGTTTPNYEWETGYDTTPATKSWIDDTDDTKDHWSTGWFWENNRTYYHFRAAGIHEGDATSHTITTDSDNGDYFTITSGALSDSNYKDYTWGAPFVDQNTDDNNEDAAKLSYSTTYGFDGPNAGTQTHQISRAIGATDDQIQMLLFHMTSQIYVNLRTTTDASAVTLKDDNATPQLAKVEILNFLADGKVLMGNGLVSTTTAEASRTAAVQMTNGNYSAASSPEPAKVTGYSYGIVPQPLTYGTSGTIGLRITTPDGNQYLVKDLSQCYATVDSTNLTNPYTEEKSSGSNTWKIDRWYPNYKYTYTVTLKKKEIDRITAAVVDWETVTGDLGNIDLEN